MPSPESLAIANALTGYSPLPPEEAERQFDEIQITYLLGETKEPENKDVKRDKDGKLYIYWYPSEEHPVCCPDTNGLSYAYLTAGWYEIPSWADVEEWVLDSACFTPDEEEVEPDHPDSWLSLLGMI